MSVRAYYNEHDKHAAAWLRELVRCGHIAGGDVDERDIRLVQPADVAGYTQCHFFAGIGVWSHALRSAGWPDERPVWTGSCPCQSFSAAGSGGGFDDERHLWPDWFRLIREQRPRTVFGEQVASKDGLAWLDFVCADMEGEGYAIAPLDLCAAGFGAPHIRQRLFFVADSKRGAAERHGHALGGTQAGVQGEARQQRVRTDAGHGGAVGRMAGADGRDASAEREQRRGEQRLLPQGGRARNLGNASGQGLAQQRGERGASPGAGSFPQREALIRAGAPAGGFWADAEWLPCRDGKARPVEPGTFPLAHGAAERVGRLRGYGNAIVAPVAEEFIRAYMRIRT